MFLHLLGSCNHVSFIMTGSYVRGEEMWYICMIISITYYGLLSQAIPVFSIFGQSAQLYLSVGHHLILGCHCACLEGLNTCITQSRLMCTSDVGRASCCVRVYDKWQRALGFFRTAFMDILT